MQRKITLSLIEVINNHTIRVWCSLHFIIPNNIIIMSQSDIVLTIRQELGSIIDPDFNQTFDELQAIHTLEVKQETSVELYLEFIPPLHYVAKDFDDKCKEIIKKHLPEAEIYIYVREKELPPNPVLPGVQNLIAVASGKGGVGKSTVAANLAISLAHKGAKVGLLDADIYGPSVPTMFGLAGEQMKAEKKDDGKIYGYPFEQYGVSVASIGFVMGRDQAAILRGPMLAGYFTTLVDQIYWGDLDYLIFDLPPGTGDIQLTMTQRIPLSGAVIVTTPQEISLTDVRRSISMFRKVNVNILGIVENMSYFIPPDMPEKRYDIFGSGGGQRVATEVGTKLLGQVPIIMKIRENADEGLPFVADPESGDGAKYYTDIAKNMVTEVRKQNKEKVSSPGLTISL